MRKEIDRDFTVLALQVMRLPCDHFVAGYYLCTRVHSRFTAFSFKNTAGQINIFGKTGN